MIVSGQREAVAEWVAGRIRGMWELPLKDFEAIGVVRDRQLIAGVVYTDYREIASGEHDIRMCCAGEGPWLTKSTLRVFFEYPFHQIRCVRVTALSAKANRKSRDLATRLGFKEEGCVRHGLGTGKDMMVYGLLKHECRWIRK
jgi:RimJ/RimL family protein N-acetyltransferase